VYKVRSLYASSAKLIRRIVTLLWQQTVCDSDCYTPAAQEAESCNIFKQFSADLNATQVSLF
jgi:hypothetical protein